LIAPSRTRFALAPVIAAGGAALGLPAHAPAGIRRCPSSRNGCAFRVGWVEPVFAGDTHRQVCRRRPGVRIFPPYNSKDDALAEAFRAGRRKLAPVVIFRSNP
jgi:hypothetical protein